MAFAPLSSIATGNVTLAWDPNPDPAVAGYNLYYGTTSGTYGRFFGGPPAAHSS